jgi:hypothetical protein
LSATIDKNYINFGAFGNGLKGGSGQVIELKVKENLFDFEVQKLTLSANSITEKYISSDAFSSGIRGGNNQKISVNVSTNFDFTTANQIDLSTQVVGCETATISSINTVGSISLSSGISFPRISWDDFGRIIDIKTSIVEVLTGRGAVAGTSAASNSLSSIFNGFITSGPQSGGNITRFTATDHNNNTYTLSSAGFLAFNAENTSLSGQILKRFAIPIFAY